MNLADQIELCQHHQQVLVFNAFNQDTAWALGNALKIEAESQRFALAIDISVNHHGWFSYLMPGATAENTDWVRRKRNLVDLLGISSYAAGLMLQQRQTTLSERYGVNSRDYAAFGGGVPLMVAQVGIVGSITVSGAPQRDDHNLVISVVARMTGVDTEAMTLLPELAS